MNLRKDHLHKILKPNLLLLFCEKVVVKLRLSAIFSLIFLPIRSKKKKNQIRTYITKFIYKIKKKIFNAGYLGPHIDEERS